MSDFKTAVVYTIKNEGGFVNDPLDPGGATNWGITLHDLAVFRDHPVTVDDVKNLEYFEACQIYKKFYWDRLGLDGFSGSEGVATAIFDIAVNRGLSTAVKYTQRCVRQIEDGILGEKTLAAIDAMPASVFLCRFVAIVQAGYVELCTLESDRLKFLPGWTARAMRLLSLMEGVSL